MRQEIEVTEMTEDLSLVDQAGEKNEVFSPRKLEIQQNIDTYPEAVVSPCSSVGKVKCKDSGFPMPATLSLFPGVHLANAPTSAVFLPRCSS